MVAMLVFLLPHFDRKICARFGVTPDQSLSSGFPREKRLLRLRRLILLGVFCCYVAANVWLVFFSRVASEEYRIHVNPLNDLKNSVSIDSGILGMLTTIYTQGLSEGFSKIHVEKPADIAQVYMNIMLYVPMGYLLPYTFDWVRARMRTRPVLLCFLCSFLTENLQLIFKRGFYDLDDLLSNTLGGLIGQLLFISVGYVVTHPKWRKELRSIRRWRIKARRHSLYPCASRSGRVRTTLVVSNEQLIREFYMDVLGFRPLGRVTDEEYTGSESLLQLGSQQIELICTDGPQPTAEQFLTIPVKKLETVAKRLRRLGIDPGEILPDPFTGARLLRIDGPEMVQITFLES